jgi:Fur family transcriptional regulator, zinc uptake regulator
MDVNDALQQLADKGYKYTGKREHMVRMFFKEKRYMSAKEVLNFMTEQYPNLSFDTVYRNLSLFEELGILESTELQGEKHYRSSCFSAEQHHHHFICTKCRKTITFDVCPMTSFYGIPDGFTITGHKFEIYGFCKECA